MDSELAPSAYPGMTTVETLTPPVPCRRLPATFSQIAGTRVFDKAVDGLRRTAFFEACIDIARRTLPAPALTWLRSQMVRNLTGTPREVFTEIYSRNIWGYQETVSGGASTMHFTEGLRQSLPGLIADLKIGTMLDLPCGDFHWMSELELPVSHYIGCDIVPLLVQNARIRYGRPNREFRTVDVCHDPLPEADLLLCRDCFVHLSEDMIFQAIDNILRSNIKYLLTTTHPEGKNCVIHNGDWFTLNLCAAPYNFPSPILVLVDWVPPGDRRQLALWEIESLRRVRRNTTPSRQPIAAVRVSP